MITLSFNFIKNYLSLLEHQDSADTDLLIIKKIFIISSFSFFISFNCLTISVWKNMMICTSEMMIMMKVKKKKKKITAHFLVLH